MLTGDDVRAARTVAAESGVDECLAELLPAGKVDAIAAIRRAHGTVMMVGDGVNDAPALAASDLGVAMGAAGSDVVLETADAALMADDLRSGPVPAAPGPVDAGRRPREHRVRARPQGALRRARAGRRRHALDGGPGRHGRIAARDRQRPAAAAPELNRNPPFRVVGGAGPSALPVVIRERGLQFRRAARTVSAPARLPAALAPREARREPRRASSGPRPRPGRRAAAGVPARPSTYPPSVL